MPYLENQQDGSKDDAQYIVPYNDESTVNLKNIQMTEGLYISEDDLEMEYNADSDSKTLPAGGKKWSACVLQDMEYNNENTTFILSNDKNVHSISASTNTTHEKEIDCYEQVKPEGIHIPKMPDIVPHDGKTLCLSNIGEHIETMDDSKTTQSSSVNPSELPEDLMNSDTDCPAASPIPFFPIGDHIETFDDIETSRSSSVNPSELLEDLMNSVTDFSTNYYR